MAMRSALVAALVMTAGLALVAASGAAVSRAHAQEAAVSIFFGFISPDSEGKLPQKVRATVSDVTCDTTEVIPVEEGRGFYYLRVASAETKTGCGVEGAPVTFLFLTGEVDSGSPAAQTQAWRVGLQYLDLSLVTEVTFGAFVGDLPPGPGFGLMRWTGTSATPVDRAVATIPRDVESIHFLDISTQSYRIYIPGAPPWASNYLLVDRDDIVFVRVR